MTVMRPSGSRVTMWSRLAEAVSAALGSIASGRSPLQALCTSLRLTSTCEAPCHISLSEREGSRMRVHSLGRLALSSEARLGILLSPTPARTRRPFLLYIHA